MDLNIVGASAIGLALLTAGGDRGDLASSIVEGPDVMVGEHLYASDVPIDRYGEVAQAEDLILEDLGRVAGVVVGDDGVARNLVVAVGGFWGIGAHRVDVSMERVHLVEGEDGARLVVDLSV